ncbi:pyridoxine 5'-phosphate synthase [Asticcacaulis sp. AC402]|uniref:pyridoxine 5'-phosphate synthase n=1 Tax=Asticcacaulis sp. AC402 TaxID=1282361 RepID=UPI0003C3EC51|nr:pyridoxine 5'-phosphate synthase [Asticcacaulis sp. AC402]ESQ75283.1 hypothetical protein ABAC402_09265 [Asticcacaulis sp. AC402]
MNGVHTPKRLTVSLETAALLPGIAPQGRVSLGSLASAALKGGANGVMLHITEDRGLVTETDLRDCALACHLVEAAFNLRMTPATDSVALALDHRPNAVYLGAETRVRAMVGAGLSLKFNVNHIHRVISSLGGAGIRTVICVEPNLDTIEAALRAGFEAIELDTLSLCEAIDSTDLDRLEVELGRITSLARYASRHGVEVQLGGGLNAHSLSILARLSVVRQINLGRATVADALIDGMACVVAQAMTTVQAAGRDQDSYEARRRRLVYRATYRGFREMDMILSSFFRGEEAALDDPALLIAERVLDLPDHGLYDLIRNDLKPDRGLNVSIIKQLRAHYRRGIQCPTHIEIHAQ